MNCPYRKETIMLRQYEHGSDISSHLEEFQPCIREKCFAYKVISEWNEGRIFYCGRLKMHITEEK